MLVKGKLEQEEVTLCNIYAPPGSSLFFREIFSLIVAESSGTCICAGDFNFLLNPKVDTTNQEQRRTNFRNKLTKSYKNWSLLIYGGIYTSMIVNSLFIQLGIMFILKLIIFLCLVKIYTE